MKTLFWLCFLLVGPAFAAPGMKLTWDAATQRLIEPGALYGRMIRLQDGALLCSYEKNGKSWVKRSDDGQKWHSPALVAQCAWASAANPELLQLKNGDILLFYNLRPHDGKHAFAISAARSHDGGSTWQNRAMPIFEAGTTFENGCWEPAALQLPSGEVLLFFASEAPYTRSAEQEISVATSRDNGENWEVPRPFSYRVGHRDGMPVPVLFSDGSVKVAIEDNGITSDGAFKPVIVEAPPGHDWKSAPVGADSPRRWNAVQKWPEKTYAGAPYLCRLPSGTTLLSCQSDEGHGAPQMTVYIGDESARNFDSRSVPFSLPRGVKGQWNSLFVKSPNTVVALSSTAINGQFGLWAVEGNVTAH